MRRANVSLSLAILVCCSACSNEEQSGLGNGVLRPSPVGAYFVDAHAFRASFRLGAPSEEGGSHTPHIVQCVLLPSMRFEVLVQGRPSLWRGQWVLEDGHVLRLEVGGGAAEGPRRAVRWSLADDGGLLVQEWFLPLERDHLLLRMGRD